MVLWLLLLLLLLLPLLLFLLFSKTDDNKIVANMCTHFFFFSPLLFCCCCCRCCCNYFCQIYRVATNELNFFYFAFGFADKCVHIDELHNKIVIIELYFACYFTIRICIVYMLCCLCVPFQCSTKIYLRGLFVFV